VAEKERSSSGRRLVVGMKIQRKAKGCTMGLRSEKKREKRETKREKKILEEKETKTNVKSALSFFSSRKCFVSITKQGSPQTSPRGFYRNPL
jgi:hypothetical protein